MDARKSRDIETKFDKLFKKLSQERFLKMEGLGNEVPFFIQSFPPETQNTVDLCVESLKKRLSVAGIEALEINLLDLCFDILRDRKKLDLLLEKEPTFQKDRLLKLMQATLDVEKELVPAIEKIIATTDDYDMAFITGIGSVYPYIRSHNILNNIQRIFKDRPLVLFFPGEYRHSPTEGATLNLFGILKGNKYYRAFDLDEYTV